MGMLKQATEWLASSYPTMAIAAATTEYLCEWAATRVPAPALKDNCVNRGIEYACIYS